MSLPLHNRISNVKNFYLLELLTIIFKNIFFLCILKKLTDIYIVYTWHSLNITYKHIPHGARCDRATLYELV